MLEAYSFIPQNRIFPQKQSFQGAQKICRGSHYISVRSPSLARPAWLDRPAAIQILNHLTHCTLPKMVRTAQGWRVGPLILPPGIHTFVELPPLECEQDL